MIITWNKSWKNFHFFWDRKTFEYFFNNEKEKYAWTTFYANVYFSWYDYELIHFQVLTSYGNKNICIV
jgi:hypothetical protein